jgi:hypothetical protein
MYLCDKFRAAKLRSPIGEAETRTLSIFINLVKKFKMGTF